MAEIPGLVTALSECYGPIRNVMLNGSAWETHFRRLAVGTRVVRLGWFVSLSNTLAIVIAESGNQVDLLVVPPHTPLATATGAMARAADPANTLRAADVLGAVPAQLVPAQLVPAPSVGAGRTTDG
jgi:hypothetical protein